MKTPYLICTQCGSTDGKKSLTRGSIWIELVLWLFIVIWLFIIVPALTYSLWRLTTRRSVCHSCESPQMVKTASPVGVELMRRFHPSDVTSTVTCPK